MLWLVNKLKCENFPASSYYPGHGDHNNTHVLPSGNQDSIFYTLKVNDEGSQTEEDPAEDELPAEDAQKHPSKFSESLAIEVSLWH